MSRRVVGKCDSRTFIKVSMISKNAIFEGFSVNFIRQRSNIKGIISCERYTIQGGSGAEFKVINMFQ